ncbi:MAG: DUF58 domain-containing protein, partial [Elusimicrobiota bacterium]
MTLKLTPAFLKKISSMTLRARYVAEGVISGLHQSPYRGSSLEFAQHRQYVPGDELKYLDWKVYGRTDRYYVKQFQEETNLRGYCILDSSASMGYKSNLSDVTKLEYATYLAAAFTYLMIKQRDAAGLITFNDKIRDYIPPRNFNEHMHLIMDKLENLKSENTTDLPKVLKMIGKRIKKRSLLVIFSDFLSPPEPLIKALKYFPFLKNDVIVFHILDPEELKLSHSGPVIYRDLESGGKIKTRPEVIRREYKKKF